MTVHHGTKTCDVCSEEIGEWGGYHSHSKHGTHWHPACAKAPESPIPLRCKICGEPTEADRAIGQFCCYACYVWETPELEVWNAFSESDEYKNALTSAWPDRLFLQHVLDRHGLPFAALQAREYERTVARYHEIAATCITDELERLGRQQEEMERLALENAKRARKIRQAVKNGHWWEVEGIVTEDALELLGNIEPSDRESLLDRDAWS